MGMRTRAAATAALLAALLMAYLCWPLQEVASDPEGSARVPAPPPSPVREDAPAQPSWNEGEGVADGDDWFACGPRDAAFALAEAAGRQVCRDVLAAARCLPPMPFDDPASGPARMRAMAQHFLADCELPPGSVALDCTEFPCVLFVEQGAFEDPRCALTRDMAARAGVVDPATLAPGERVWDMMWMVDPRNRFIEYERRATARWRSRLRWTEPLLEHESAEVVPTVPMNCQQRDAVLDAADDDELCDALMEHWGCDAPDMGAYTRRLEEAGDARDQALDPECSVADPSLTLLDCSREPCMLVYLDDRAPDDRQDAPALCPVDALTPPTYMSMSTDWGALRAVPLWPADLDDRDRVGAVYRQERDFRGPALFREWWALHGQDRL